MKSTLITVYICLRRKDSALIVSSSTTAQRSLRFLEITLSLDRITQRDWYFITLSNVPYLYIIPIKELDQNFTDW